ncbi:MAG TPA: hypothetical protein GX696_00565, partial [Pseudomonadaceae bacterium]|nr:hypothetical protein [Pseudomonadaceae bacterium]
MSLNPQIAGGRKAATFPFVVCMLTFTLLSSFMAQAQTPDSAALSSDASLTVTTGQVQHVDFTRYLNV